MMKKVLIICGIIFLIIILSIIGGLLWYNSAQKPVNTKEVKQCEIEIKSGMSTEKILNLLHENGLIKNVFASEIYIKLNDVKGLQAGKYNLSSYMSLIEILEQISSGKIVDETISITFVEGKNMRWVAKTIAENTNNIEDQVYELLQDKEYIKTLINKYWFLTDDILDANIYYPLEGYLWPDTYKFENKDVSVIEIFNTLLSKTEKVLEENKTQIQNSKIVIHRIMTFASIVELEGRDKESKNEIASVIYNRLAKNMSIGSDVTTYYGIKVDMSERNLYKSEINTYNSYNTRGPNMEGKLPVGPIAMVSKDAINAVLTPTKTDYLYFVADSNGKIYFSKTYEEHQEIINNLRQQGLWYEYE